MVGIGRSKDIISDVGANVASRVVPVGATVDAADGAHLLAAAELETSVGVRLDVVSAARPTPVGVKGSISIPSLVYGETLATRAGALSPLVVVEDVTALGLALVLVAKSGQRERRKSGQGEELELHLEQREHCTG